MDKNKENIKVLEKKFKKGNETAFKLLFELYHEKLTVYINSYTNNSSDTQDIVQDAFIKLWDSKHKLTKGKSISGYLFKIAYNIFIDNYRRNKQESKLMDTLAYKRTIEIIEQDDERKNSRIAQIKTAIDGLPPKCKEVFKMSKIQGFKYHEIAESLNISVKTVEAQMGKAFSIIREKVKDSNSLMFFLNFCFKKSKQLRL